MQNKIKKCIKMLGVFFLVGTIITSCASVRYVTPQVAKTELALRNFSSTNTQVVVTDYRVGSHADEVCSTIQKQLTQALSQDDVALSDVAYSRSILCEKL
ncbi:MAG: hypothetical protein P1P64_08465 [Treponemataceae bacterium]